MIPHTQTIFYEGPDKPNRGNCWQTAIASVLDLQLEDVPHFIEIDDLHGVDWWDYSIDWAWFRGYELVDPERHIYTNEYYLASGPSPRGNFWHVVVCKNGKMVHDPHPSQAGLVSMESFTVFRQR